jgi:hypothetical protein
MRLITVGADGGILISKERMCSNQESKLVVE